MLARPDSHSTAPVRAKSRSSRYVLAILAVFLLLAIVDCYVMWILLRGH